MHYALRVSVAAAALWGAAARIPASDEAISPPGRLRDPFRPVGYRPPLPPGRDPSPPPAAPQTPARDAPPPELWEEARRMVAVQGVTSIGDRKMAMINDRVVGVGDKVELFYAGFIFRWIVDNLDERGVGLRRVEETGGPASGSERPPVKPPQQE